MDLIGKPIKINRPDLIDKSQLFGALLTDISVPFEGANKSGSLQIEADRPTTEDEWSVRKLSLRFANVPEKMLIVYRRKELVKVATEDNTETTTTENTERRKHEWLWTTRLFAFDRILTQVLITDKKEQTSLQLFQ